MEGGKNATAVATSVLSDDKSRLTSVDVIFTQQPAWRSSSHFGSRLAQDVGTHLGKVLRIDPVGGPAVGNIEIAGGLPEVWSYGHRNIQSAGIGPDGALWTVEHGLRGGDELNRPKPGANYG